MQPYFDIFDIFSRHGTAGATAITGINRVLHAITRPRSRWFESESLITSARARAWAWGRRPDALMSAPAIYIYSPPPLKLIYMIENVAARARRQSH